MTIGDAFARLIEKTIKPASGMDVAAAVHFAAMRIFMKSTLTVAESRNALPVLDFLDEDPIDISDAIEKAIKTKKLTVEDLPDDMIAEWIADPYVNDWSKGWVLIEEDGVAVPYQPTLSRVELDALFGLEAESADAPMPQEKIGPVSASALEMFVRTTMAKCRLTQPDIRERTRLHFAPKHFTETQWRAVWKDEPNKLRPGEKVAEKDSGKSGV